MKQVAPHLWQLKSRLPIPNAFNMFLAGDVLIDAGRRADARKILGQLEGHDVTAHALTHAHPDHQGSSAAVCEALGVPYWVPAQDAPKAEHPERMLDECSVPFFKLSYKTMTGPGRAVDRKLQEGDEVGGFRVVSTPGHTSGHVSFFRESDRVLIVGDVVMNLNIYTMLPGLHESKPNLTYDLDANRASARKLASLEPAIICFGHGAVLRDGKRFADYCNGLGT